MREKEPQQLIAQSTLDSQIVRTVRMGRVARTNSKEAIRDGVCVCDRKPTGIKIRK